MLVKFITRTSFALLCAFSFSIQANAQSVLSPNVRENIGDLIEPYDSICGNGIREPGEQCDHGDKNGIDQDVCSFDCQYDIPEDMKDCVKQTAQECLDQNQEEESRLDIIPLDQVTKHQLQEREIEIDPKGKTKKEECLEAAILECRPEESEVPETPETPETPTEDETPKDQVTPNIVSFEGSGCSLGSVTGVSNGLGWFYLIGLGLTLFRGRRS